MEVQVYDMPFGSSVDMLANLYRFEYRRCNVEDDTPLARHCAQLRPYYRSLLHVPLLPQAVRVEQAARLDLFLYLRPASFHIGACDSYRQQDSSNG